MKRKPYDERRFSNPWTPFWWRISATWMPHSGPYSETLQCWTLLVLVAILIVLVLK